MQFKVLSALLLATLAVATPVERRQTSQCDTGSAVCCNSLQSANSPATALLLGLLGISAQDVTALVGVTCTPISVIGVPGNSCSAQPACCTNDGFNGVVALGCTPLNLNA